MEFLKKEINAIKSILNDVIKEDKVNAYIFLLYKESRVTVMVDGSLLGQAIALENARQKKQFRKIECIADQIAEIKKEKETCGQSTETPDNGEI